MLDNDQKTKLNEDIRAKAKELKKEMQQEQKNVLEQSQHKSWLIKKELRNAKREKADKKSDEALKKAMEYAGNIKQAGYDSWLSAMGEIVGMCRLLVDVKPLNLLAGAAAEIGFSAVELVTGKIVDKLAGVEGHPGFDLRPGTILDAAISAYENSGMEPANLAVLQHYIEFKEDGKLNLATIGTNMRRSDGKSFTPEQEARFQDTLHKGVVLWLDSHGYDLVGRLTDSFVKRDHPEEPLTKAQFDDLRDDPDTGLDAFLSGAYDMTFEQASGPKSSLRP